MKALTPEEKERRKAERKLAQQPKKPETPLTGSAAAGLDIPAVANEDLAEAMTHQELADAFTALCRPAEEAVEEPSPAQVAAAEAIAAPHRRVSGDELREIQRQQRREARLAEKGY